MTTVKNKKISQVIIDTSNDYSRIERKFKKITGCNLIKLEKKAIKLAFEPVSIIIPTYIGERLDLILKNLDKQTYRNFEVIVVDDASPNNVADMFRNLKLNFPLKYIRVMKNQGTSAGINTGLISSSYNITVVMDQDMIPPRDFLAKMVVRQQFTKNTLFVGFREGIEYYDYIKNKNRKPKIFADWRCRVKDNEDFLDLTVKQAFKYEFKKRLNLTKESDYFKKFSYGKSIGHWDLSCMVIGHSMCFKKSEAIGVGGFIEKFFIGWGMDDIAFGASMIANGNFIIPAVDWVSYHINHKRYSGSRKVEKNELDKNLKLYLDSYLNMSITKLKFARHQVREVGRADKVTYYESKK